MNKLKVLLSLLMAVLIAFASQKAYNVKTDMLSSIYSDVVFTRLAVESQEYTRQIEYGLKNGKSLENFYNIESILNGMRRCFSYTNGVYIFSDDYKILYSLSESSVSVDRIKVADFTGDTVYSVFDDTTHARYILTLPIFGRNNEVCGYMVLDISRSGVENKLADYQSEYIMQSVLVGILCWLAGVVFLVHFCRSKKDILRDGLIATTAAVSIQVAVDSALSIFKFSVTIESLIQQTVSKITMSLQNNLDSVSEKGVALSKIYDLNSWLMENCNDIPFIDNLIYDRNYRIIAVISDEYMTERIWNYAAALVLTLALCIALGVVLILGVAAINKMVERYKEKKHYGEKERIGNFEQQSYEELVSDSHA